VAAIVIGVNLLGYATEDTVPKERPQTPAAATALRDYDKSVALAEEVCRNAKLAAERKLVERLKATLAVVTRAGNLIEANRIDEEIKAAGLRIDDLVPHAPRAVDLKAFVLQHPNFTYEWVAKHDKRRLEFLPDGHIGMGNNPREQAWRVAGTSIFISGNVGEAELVLSDNGTFKGKWMDTTGSEITLTPITLERVKR
jgi:hypothetical protein